MQRTYWPGKSFVPPKVKTKITVIRGEKQQFHYKRDPKLGWAGRSGTGVDTFVVPGDHRTVFREPVVRHLAAKLMEAIDRAWYGRAAGAPEAGREKTQERSMATGAA
jgi:hypothetical protein